MPGALKSLRARRIRGVICTLAVALVAVLVFSTVDGPAVAQESVVIGGRGLPAIEVNLDVLKDLGAPLQRRRLRMPGQRDQDPDVIRLKPPPGVAAQEFTIRTPRVRPEPPATARTGPESPGRDPLVRLRQPGETPSRASARSTRRAVPAVSARPPVERQVLAPPPAAKDKKETAPPIRTAERSRAEPAAPERRERVTPPPPPPPRAVERVITRSKRSGARAALPAPEQTAKPAEPPPLPPRVTSREAVEPRQKQQEARIAPEPVARPRPLQRPAAPRPAKEPGRFALQEKPPVADRTAPAPVLPTADDEATARVRPTVRAEPPPPAVRPAAPREEKTAALPPARAPVHEEEALRVVFSGSSSRLAEEGEAALRALVQSIAETETRIQLKAFAAGSADRPSTARRLSLSRALAVRSFLIEQGMRSTRIDVRALGVPADDGPADRVDVILLTQ